MTQLSLPSLDGIQLKCMVVPPVKLSTVGSRAFPVVGPQIWNDLPEDVASAESLSTFRQRLKTHLFTKSFPDCFWTFINILSMDLAVDFSTWATLKIYD